MPPNTACSERPGLAAFFILFLNYGGFPFPSLSLPSRTPKGHNAGRGAAAPPDMW